MFENSGVQVERIAVAINPISTRFSEAEKEINALKNASKLDIFPISTQPDVESMRQELHENEADDPSVIIWPWTGDGTLPTIIEAVEPGQIVVPRPGGNACDMAWMINGDSSAEDILRYGRPVDLRYLEVGVTHHNVRTHLLKALGYCGVGSSAKIGRRIHDLKESDSFLLNHDHTRFIIEAFKTFKTAESYPPFRVHRQDGSEPQTITDISVVNGNRIAKAGVTHADLRLGNMEVLTTGRLNRRETARKLINLSQGKLFGEMFVEEFDESSGQIRPAGLSFEVASLNGSMLPLHCDGDMHIIKPPCVVTVEVSPRTYRTLSTKL